MLFWTTLKFSLNYLLITLCDMHQVPASNETFLVLIGFLKTKSNLTKLNLWLKLNDITITF